MARKLRLEFPGAIYHVINRGNHRTNVFATAGARGAFEKCLFETVAKSGWVLHAFVVMRNHFHLAVETPAGNLGAGMQWLQATFANRFNRLRGERGHLFQGRYKALVVEPGETLGLVCHYIHLNPVRAGVVPVEELSSYRASSYWHLGRDQRPEGLRVTAALAEAGGWADSPAGRAAYAKYLAWQAAEGPAGRNAAYVAMSRGWALGGDDFKANLQAEHDLPESGQSWDAGGRRELREAGWAKALEQALRAVNHTTAEALTERKSAPWKVAVAAHLKATTQVENRWLAAQLHMGSPVAVSHHTGQLRRGRNAAAAAFQAEINRNIKH